MYQYMYITVRVAISDSTDKFMDVSERLIWLNSFSQWCIMCHFCTHCVTLWALYCLQINH